MFFKYDFTSLQAHGYFPYIISKAIMPNDQISDFDEYGIISNN